MLKSLLTEELSMNQAYLILQNNGIFMNRITEILRFTYIGGGVN